MSKKATAPVNDELQKDNSPHDTKDCESRGSTAAEKELSDTDLQSVVGGNVSAGQGAILEKSKQASRLALKIMVERQERETQVTQKLTSN